MLEKQCTFETASKWLSILVFLLSAAFAGVDMWALTIEKSLIRVSWESSDRFLQSTSRNGIRQKRRFYKVGI